MSGTNEWGPALLDLYRVWTEAMERAQAAGLSEDAAADVVGAWLRAKLTKAGAQ